MDKRFAHIADWIFDLDNCLYPASTRLFDLIDERMGAFIERLLGCDPAEAKRVQKSHFHEHGTTLAGLMKHHAVDPRVFLDDVHAIALDRLAPDTRLAGGLARLPGRKIVFTNGTRPTLAASSPRSASPISLPSFTTSTPPSFAPSPTSTAIDCCSTGSASTRRAR